MLVFESNSIELLSVFDRKPFVSFIEKFRGGTLVFSEISRYFSLNCHTMKTCRKNQEKKWNTHSDINLIYEISQYKSSFLPMKTPSKIGECAVFRQRIPCRINLLNYLSKPNKGGIFRAIEFKSVKG